MINGHIDVSVEKLKILNEMSCNKELSLMTCKNCEFYYETEYNTIACIKNDIRTWTLYRIGKEEGIT